jgi:TolB-like protein
LKLVITSRQFAKAHRCTTLLTYLIERALNRQDSASPPEQEIGVAVFGRDPNTYFPGDDPIVRVQAGRLRLRLAAYYADEGAADPLRITVPLGSYQARIALAEGKPERPGAEAMPVLMFSPLTCLSAEPPAGSYTSGLNDELGYRLYRDLASYRLLGQHSLAAQSGRQRAVHVLEGTVRQDASRLRVSLHLRHGEEGTVLWYAQFDSAGDGSIAGQEQMAERCVQALQRHMLG